MDNKRILTQLINDNDLSDMSLRAVGKMANESKPLFPSVVKYHWQKLYDNGEVSYLNRVMQKSQNTMIDDNALRGDAKLISIPIYGVADCGPATKVAEQYNNGKLSISSSLLKTKRYDDLYALIASGISMNESSINGKSIHDGDYVIVDHSKNQPENGDYVVAIVGGLANIKKFHREGDRIALLSESSERYNPIYIKEEEQNDSLIGGTVIQVINGVHKIS